MYLKQHPKKFQLAGKQASYNDKKLRPLQEQIECLYEVIESLNLELNEKSQQLLEYEEELKQTNNELRMAVISFDIFTLDEAKQLGQKILATKKSARECLADLIGTLYQTQVESWELEPFTILEPGKLGFLKPGAIESFCPQNNRMTKELGKLKSQVVVTKNLVFRLQSLSEEMKAKMQQMEKNREALRVTTSQQKHSSATQQQSC